MDDWQTVAADEGIGWRDWFATLTQHVAADECAIVHRQRNLLVRVSGPDGQALVASAGKAARYLGPAFG